MSKGDDTMPRLSQGHVQDEAPRPPGQERLDPPQVRLEENPDDPPFRFRLTWSNLTYPLPIAVMIVARAPDHPKPLPKRKSGHATNGLVRVGDQGLLPGSCLSRRRFRRGGVSRTSPRPYSEAGVERRALVAAKCAMAE